LIEQARTPWATDPAQRVGSSGLPFGVPPAYALTRDLKLTHDVGLGLSLTKELSGAFAAPFHHLKVAPGAGAQCRDDYQERVHVGHRSEVGTFVEQFGVDARQCLIDELVGLEGS
jgi:hypothetical protein